MKLTTEYLDTQNITYDVDFDGYIHVGGDLYLGGTHITELPEKFSVKEGETNEPIRTDSAIHFTP